MVSPQHPNAIKVDSRRTLQKPSPLSFLSLEEQEVGELDFSDVFGTITELDHASIVTNTESSPQDSLEDVYDDPVVIQNRTHSLVGPTEKVSIRSQLAKKFIDEAKNSLAHEECIIEETAIQMQDRLEANLDMPILLNGAISNECVGYEDFQKLKLVGQGGFGKVYQVRKNGTSEIYAMKVMRKDRIMEKNHAGYMKAERDILKKVDHPFIIQLRYSFQTRYHLYLVLDFVNGGHLFFQLYDQGIFREELARIYTAEIVSAVSHLHANGIMHRDLKPENILLDADGHAMLTDFGLAKEFKEDTSCKSMVGTLEYMAPEILQGNGHDKAADWWSIGILLFEMLTGKPPFVGNRHKIQHSIVKKKLKMPAYLTSEAHSLLKGLLQKDANMRLGSGLGGSDEIKKHKWFKSINWKKLDAREIEPSFRPNVAGKHCIANFEKRYTKMDVLNSSPVGSPVGEDWQFNGFSYVNPSHLHSNLRPSL